MYNLSRFVKLYKGKFKNTNDLNKKNFYEHILNNPELHHAYNCYVDIPTVKEKFQIPSKLFTSQGSDQPKGTIIFEDRELPHLEYLLRKTIALLGEEWGHTIVCTDKNINYITLMCENIHHDINIINLESFEANQNTYNNLFLSNELWEQIPYEKVLVYQQDADIYNSNIEQFLKYDFIGAPWSDDQDDNDNLVGNGGFALRSKSKMIECLDRIDPGKIKLNKSTIEYMMGRSYLGFPMDHPPEDVYYSKTMIDYNLGVVATKDIAKEFANETYYSKTAFGCHQHWRYNKSHLFKNIGNCKLLDTSWVDGEAQHHVSGWPGVMGHAEASGVVTREHTGDNQLTLVDNLEKYFVWENKEAITRPWLGITHCTPNAPPYLSIIDIDTLLCNQNFIKSLPMCKCIITLTKYMQQYLYRYIKKTPVRLLYHPTHTVEPSDKFSTINFNNIKNNFISGRLNVVQLGQQLRHMTSIYRLKTEFKKIWLTGTSDLNKMNNLLKKEADWMEIEIDYDCVEMKFVKDVGEYKELIYNSIVIIELIDASANNAVLELASAEIPFFIKKLQAIVEYLGYNYPMYFDDITEVEDVLSSSVDYLEEIIERTTMYLSKLDKTFITHQRFTKDLLTVCNE